MPMRILKGPARPARLADYDECPEVLYLHGALPRGAGVAIVGTRVPSPAARDFARKLAADLARAGVSIWSGGAKGIDTAAHEGALDAGGTTVVVAPAGFNRPFPEENRALFQRVVDTGGGYLSAEPCDVAAHQSKFFPRNAILVACAHILVVVEAGFRSGARNAAKWARRLQRPLFAVPTTPWNEAGTGCLLELRLGARLLMDERCVLRELARIRAHPLAPGRPARGPAQATLDLSAGGPDAAVGSLSPRERVVSALEAGASHADAIVQETGLTAAQVQEAVLTLTLDGVLAPDPAGGLKIVSRQYR
ncbi:MAG TPA: DNA-processing protein DprA [Polyangiaceae bacterium]|nr:DNA-processing protein DprA [Polyangiaceae bacterium]